MLGSNLSNVPENNSVAVSFTHLKLRKEHKEFHEESKAESDDM